VLAFAVSFSALSATSSFAFSAEAQQMCTGDAFRLCSDEIPNIPKITACMFKKRASLSTGCRAVMDAIWRRNRTRSPRSNPASAPAFAIAATLPKTRCGAGSSALERASVHDRVGVTP